MQHGRKKTEYYLKLQASKNRIYIYIMQPNPKNILLIVKPAYVMLSTNSKPFTNLLW